MGGDMGVGTWGVGWGWGWGAQRGGGGEGAWDGVWLHCRWVAEVGHVGVARGVGRAVGLATRTALAGEGAFCHNGVTAHGCTSQTK